MTLFYVPLESYQSRYTQQLSAPKTGWLERNWIKAGIDYVRVDGIQRTGEITSGVVLDAVGRSTYAFSQIRMLLEMAEAGQITHRDVIYFDDFWHPGIEALPYAFAQIPAMRLGSQPQAMGGPRMYAFLWAQSVDEFDFTHNMRHWMRHFEIGIASILDGIFVCCPTLRDLVCFGGIAPRTKIHVVGQPICSEEMMKRMPRQYAKYIVDGASMGATQHQRENKVIFSSRWDWEKNPQYFVAIAIKVLARRPKTKFVVCTGNKTLRSNNPMMLELLQGTMKMFPEITVRENLTKEEYYAELASAKIQINTASQDFVPFTLLEASVAGCYPLYPYFRSFPETFLHRNEFMYQHKNVDDAADKVITILDRESLWTRDEIKKRSWIHKRFDSSWRRMMKTMGYASFANEWTDPFEGPFSVSM